MLYPGHSARKQQQETVVSGSVERAQSSRLSLETWWLWSQDTWWAEEQLSEPVGKALDSRSKSWFKTHFVFRRGLRSLAGLSAELCGWVR